MFLQHMSDFAAMNAVYAEFFTEGQYPARSAVEVQRSALGRAGGDRDHLRQVTALAASSGDPTGLPPFLRELYQLFKVEERVVLLAGRMRRRAFIRCGVLSYSIWPFTFG